jgi:type IV secretory pathway VirB6-like protein
MSKPSESLLTMSQVAFGGNIGAGNFNAQQTNLSNIASTLNPAYFTCFLYQTTFGALPPKINNIAGLPIHLSNWALGRLALIFKNLGCPQAIY